MRERSYLDEPAETREALEEAAGKTINLAIIVTDHDEETRGIGCRSRQRLMIHFSDGTVLEVYPGGNFGSAATPEVDVTLHAISAYPAGK